MVVYVTKYVNAVVHTHRQLTQDRTGNIQWLVEDQLMSMHPYQHQEVHSLSNHMDYSVKKQKGKKTLKFLELIFFGFMKKENIYSIGWGLLEIQSLYHNSKCFETFVFKAQTALFCNLHYINEVFTILFRFYIVCTVYTLLLKYYRGISMRCTVHTQTQILAYIYESRIAIKLNLHWSY